MKRIVFLQEYHKASDQLDKRRLKTLVKKSTDVLNEGKRGHHNMIICMEELAELGQQTSKQLRGIGDKFNLLEEMADVFLGLEYLKDICGISQLELHKAINVKLDRVERNIKERRAANESSTTKSDGKT